MSITFVGSISPASTTMRDGCTDEINNRIDIVESSGPSFRQFSMTSPFTQFGSNVTCLTAPAAVCLLNSASAVIRSSSVTTTDYIELATNYRTNASSVGGAIPVAGKGQQCAADMAQAVAFFASSTSNAITKVTATAVTSNTVPSMSNDTVTCVILKGPDRWLLGTAFGAIYEINSSVSVLDSYHTNMLPQIGMARSASPAACVVKYMSFSDNLLTVTTGDGSMIIMDWSTKTIMYQNQVSIGQNHGLAISHSASGVFVAGHTISTNDNKLIYETDGTVIPGQVNDILYTDNSGTFPALGINITTATAWAIQNGTEKIRIFTLAPRTSSTQTFTIQSPSGTNVLARLLLIDDTGGQGTDKIVLDTIMQSPGTYRIPSGKSLIAIAKYGEGSTAKWEAHRIST